MNDPPTETFSALNNLINVEWVSNTTIDLSSNYEYADSDSIYSNGISISNRNLTINGNGMTIDGTKRSRIFSIENSNVTFKNINFIKGRSNEFGGAIYGACNLINCNFSNSSARYDGGAVYFGAINDNNDNGKSKIINCSFSDNDAKYNGGAIYGDCIVKDSNFTNNSADESGGAIYGNCSAENSNFIDNHAYSMSVDIIEKGGGAIFTSGKNISKCTFINNNLTGEQSNLMKGGGAIHFSNEGNLEENIFINNHADNNGGAVWAYDLTAKNNIFLNNTSYFGNEIYVEENSNLTYNWFGNNESNYNEAPALGGSANSNSWLFLNATANPDSIPAFNLSEISFLLFSYDNETETASEYDNEQLPEIYLSANATNGHLNNDTVKLGDSVKFNGTSLGTGTVTAKIKYGNALDGETLVEESISIEITRRDPNLDFSFSPAEISYGENATITLQYEPEATGTVNITFEGKTHNKTFENIALANAIEIGDMLLPDEYNISISYSGDEYFTDANNTAEEKLTVKKLPSDIDVDAKEILVNESNGVIFRIILPENATGTINISWTGHFEEANTADGQKDSGKLYIDIKNQGYAVGEYETNLTFLENEIYLNSTKTFTFKIISIPTEIIAGNDTISLNVGDKSKVEYSLNPSDAVGKITFASNDTSVVSVNPNTGEIEALKEGQAKITIKFEGNENYTETNAEITVTVSSASSAEKRATQISAKDITAIYNIKKELVISLKDSNGNPVRGAEITVNLGSQKKYTSDSNGQVKVNIGKLTPKTYKAKISFAGNDAYKASSATVKVTVKKAKPKITAKKKSFKAKTKVKKYTVTLKNNVKKALKNKKLTLKVKGKTYKAKTNKKGKAIFKIKNLKKKGKYKAVIKFKGDKYYKKASKKVRITVKESAFKTVSKGSKDKPTVKQIQRALKRNGFYLSYKGRYLKVDGIYHKYTKMGVRQYQKANGLKATGKVDEKTAKKLKII